MCLLDVEECQLSECGAEEELGGGESPLPRSSSTSDITQQLADHFPGMNSVIKITYLVYVEGILNMLFGQDLLCLSAEGGSPICILSNY